MGYSHVIPELFLKFSNNRIKVDVFSPYHKRAFCYIDDAIKLIIGSCFKRKSLNKVFNIGNMNEEVKIIDLVKKIKKILHSKKKIFLRENTLGSPFRRIPDTKQIQEIVKIKNFISLNEGLKKTILWYQKK